MDFSCKWAAKTSRDRLFWGRAKGKGLLFFCLQEGTDLSDSVQHPLIASVCYPGYSPNLVLSPVVLVKSEPLQSCAKVRA